MNKKIRVAIYARFSTDKQRDASIEDQIASCRDFAIRQGWEIVQTYSDRAISGASMFRAGIEQLQRDAKAGQFDIILSEAMDRLSRNLGDIAKFHERMEHLNVKIWTLTERHVDQMMIGMKGTMNAIQLRDIALKTARGQRGRVRQGKCAGGNSYGYDVLPGKVVGGKTEYGERSVNDTQAAIIRRIFTEYAQGFSAKKIAERLNRERIPAPRGGHWSATTILGSRTRRTGIINNTAYIGEMVWNKSSYRKDPDTAKRQATINPEDILEHVTVPHLRIVDDGLWEAVRLRQGPMVEKGPGMRVCDHRRPKTLFSGLMRCGCCGSGFSKVSKNGFGCSAARNKGDAVCQNKRVIHQADLEALVLDALSNHLMAPEAVEHFCKVYAAERNRLASEANSGIEKLEEELVSIKAQQKRLVQAILAGVDASDVKDEMAELKAQQSQLESALAAAQRSEGPKVRFHPRMAEVYRDRVGALIRGLAGDRECIEVWEAVRGLIDKLVISPDLDDPDGKGSVVDVHGSLAALLCAATDAPLFRRPDLKRVATNGQAARNAALQDIDNIEELVLVAGAGFEPAAFRL